jgi:hypothetical protein
MGTFIWRGSVTIQCMVTAQITDQAMGFTGEFRNAQQFASRERTGLLKLTVFALIDFGEGDSVVAAVLALVLPEGRFQTPVSERLDWLVLGRLSCPGKLLLSLVGVSVFGICFLFFSDALAEKNRK